jgi:hypothetical protein
MNNHLSLATNKYPVGIFMWRRDAYLKSIIESIKEYGPKKLYLFVDGPRNNNEQAEINKVVQTCKLALENVSFDVVFDLSSNHMGLNKRFRTGLHRLFSAEACAIVLEDDTLPSPSFFDFCSYYLDACYNRKDIVAINGYFKTGSSFIKDYDVQGAFTNHIFNPWGWASWSHKILPLYNPDLRSVNLWESLRVFALWWNLDIYRLRRKLLRNIEIGVLNTWDVQLQWSIFLAQKKVLTTPVNLISNVGNDNLATTYIAGSSDFNQATGDLLSTFFSIKIRHLPNYDKVLCRAKSNLVFIKKELRKCLSS